MNQHPEYQYLDLLRDCLENGERREGRNGVTHGLFGRQIRFDLSKGFPLLTTKRVHWKAIVVELLWFLRGDTNAKWMEDQGVNIWREWGNPVTREMGRVYGAQWRDWVDGTMSCKQCEGDRVVVDHEPQHCGDEPTFKQCPTCGSDGVTHIDQIAKVIDGLRSDPHGRRHIVTAWNPAEIDDMALPPCHCLFQFFVANGKLSCQLYQRSADVFLGVPFNIASYALLTHLIAREVGLEVGEFIHTFGDVHLYDNHVEQAREQLSRQPRAFPSIEIRLQHDDDYHRATLVCTGMGCIDYTYGDILLWDYDPYPAIKAEVSA